MQYHECRSLDLWDCKELEEMFSLNRVDNNEVLKVGHTSETEHER